MLDAAYLASRAKLIDMKKAQDFKAGNPVKGGTIYLTAADESGMMVSFIQSNYMGFGSGCVEPEFGISLQNRGHGFSLDAAAPTWWRRASGPSTPSSRPSSRRTAQPVMSFGVMGGNMQPQGHMQTLVRMLDYGQNPQAACDAPRWRFNARAGDQRRRRHEPRDGAGPDGAGPPGRRHQRFATRTSAPASSSGVRASRAVEGYVAASDPRRDGLAAGF